MLSCIVFRCHRRIILTESILYDVTPEAQLHTTVAWTTVFIQENGIELQQIGFRIQYYRSGRARKIPGEFWDFVGGLHLF